MRQERQTHPSQISTVYCVMAESMELVRNGPDPRARGIHRLTALRGAMDLVRLAREHGLPRVGVRATGAVGEVQDAFAKGWSEDPELARLIFDVVTDLPRAAFRHGEARTHFAQRLFGVEIKGEEIVPLHVPQVTPSTISIGNGGQ